MRVSLLSLRIQLINYTCIYVYVRIYSCLHRKKLMYSMRVYLNRHIPCNVWHGESKPFQVVHFGQRVG